MRYHKVLFISLFLCFGYNVAHAQEYVKELLCNDSLITDFCKGYRPIVRGLPDGRWLMHTCTVPFFEERFTMISDESNVASEMLLYAPGDFNSAISVADMKVRRDTVFFCGGYEENGEERAALGYFSISDFPYSTIHMFTVPTAEYFCKIAVSHISLAMRHISLVARMSDGTYQLVDAFPLMSGEMQFDFSGALTGVNRVDDVVITESHTVFSARNTTTQQSYIYCFQNTSSHASTLTSPYYKKNLGITTDKEVRMTRLGGGEYAMVISTCPNFLYVSVFDSTKWQFTKFFLMQCGEYDIMDIVGQGADTVELLLREYDSNQYTDYTNAMIFTVPVGSISTVPVTIRRFTFCNPFSLDHLPLSPKKYAVASRVAMYSEGFCISRYQHGIHGDCSEITTQIPGFLFGYELQNDDEVLMQITYRSTPFAFPALPNNRTLSPLCE